MISDPVTCSSREFTCDNQQCVDARAKCDGRYDCSDYSDEANCRKCYFPLNQTAPLTSKSQKYHQVFFLLKKNSVHEYMNLDISLKVLTSVSCASLF